MTGRYLNQHAGRTNGDFTQSVMNSHRTAPVSANHFISQLAKYRPRERLIRFIRQKGQIAVFWVRIFAGSTEEDALGPARLRKG